MTRDSHLTTPASVRYLKFGENVIEVTIIRRRRKTIAIHVFPDRPVELRAPLKCPWSEIEGFLQARRQWIVDSLRSLAGNDAPVSQRFIDGELHYFMGAALTLQVGEGRTRRVGVTENAITVRCKAPDNPDEVRKALEDFYRREALRILPERVRRCRERFAEMPAEPVLSVRKMRSKWGSCSSRGEICLNSLLMQKPIEAIDFVVTHELCHMRHFAHNKSFYRLMDRTMPDWREREKLLDRNDVLLQMELF